MQRYIFHTIITRGLSTFFNFLIALIIARHAGPAVKGDVTLLITAIWFVTFFSGILGGQVLVYILPRSKPEAVIFPAYLWAFFIAAVAYVLFLLTSLLPVSLLFPVAAISFLASVMEIHQTIMLSRQQIRAANLIALFPLVLQAGGIALCFYALNIHDVWAYLYATIFAYIIATFGGLYFLRNYLRASTLFSLRFTPDLKQLLLSGMSFQAVEILQLLHLRYYFFQLGLQQGNTYLGIYSIGISILESVWIIPRSISRVHYAHTSNTPEPAAAVQRTISLLQLSLFLSGAALVLLWFVPSSVYSFVFGHGFSDVRHSIRFLFPGIFIYNIVIVISSFYLGAGNYKPLVFTNLSGAVAVIIFSRLLLPQYVMSGAGLAATLSYAIAAAVLLFLFTAGHSIAPSSYFRLTSLLEEWQHLKKQLLPPNRD